MLKSSTSICPGPRMGWHRQATRLLTWYATKRPPGASTDEIVSRIWDPETWLMVEKGIPEIRTSGVSGPYIERIFFKPLALPRWAISRSSLMRLTKVRKCGLFSILRSLERCAIAFSIAVSCLPWQDPVLLWSWQNWSLRSRQRGTQGNENLRWPIRFEESV